MKTRKKLNLRFLISVVAVCAVLGIGIHFVHGYQVKRNASALLVRADKAKEEAQKAREEADKALEENDLAKEEQLRAKEQEHLGKELSYLLRYIGMDRGNFDARVRYGEALDEQAKKTENPRTRREAYQILERVLRQEPNHARQKEIRRRLVDTAMAFGQFNDALAHLDKLRESDPRDGELLRLKGICEAAKGDFVEAEKDYKRAIENAPDQIDNYLNLAALYRDRLKKPEEAIKLLGRMVKAGKPESRAYLSRAQYYLQFEATDPAKLKLAQQDVQKARDLDPDDPQVVLTMAEIDKARETPDGVKHARNELRKGLKTHPRNADLYYSLIVLESRNDNIKEALRLARQGLEDLHNLPDEDRGKSSLIHALADLLVQNGDLKDAEVYIARLKKNKRFPKPLLDYLQARYFTRQNKWSEASKLLDTAIRRLSQQPALHVQALLLLGQCYEQLSNPDQALFSYKEAIKVDPLSIATRYRIATLNLAQNRNTEALADFRSLLTTPKLSSDMHLRLARSLIILNRRLERKDRNLDEIRKELALVKADSAELPILQAETILLDDEKQKDAARAVIEKARQAKPDEFSFWLAEAQLCEPEKAVLLLKEARARPKLAGNVELRLAQIRYLMPISTQTPEQQKKAVDALRITLGEMEKEAKDLTNTADRVRLLNGLADTHSKLGDFGDAQRLWNQVAELQPLNLAVRLVLYDLALLNKKGTAMDRLLEEMRSIEGEDGVYWKYAKASRLIQEADPENKGEVTTFNGRSLLRDARKYLVQAGERRRSWARIPTLEATIDEREGNVPAAIEKYKQAVGLGEQRPEIIRRLVELLLKQGRFNEANEVVRKLSDQEDTLVSYGLGKLAAADLLSRNDPKRALELASKSVSKDSTAYQDHLWLGRVQWAAALKAGEADKAFRAAKLEEAEKSFRKACELGEKEKAGGTWVTLVSFLKSIDKKQEAIQAIEEAKKKLPMDEAHPALAACYESVGDLKKAEEEYQAALKAAPKNVPLLRLAATFYTNHGQANLAEPLLREIIDLKGQQVDDDVMWARRGLSAVLASNRSRRKFEEALNLIDLNLEQDKNSVLDKHAKALLLSTRISTRREAIRLLEELDKSTPLVAQEQFILAQLYVAEKDWENARMRMQLLLTMPEGKNPTYEAFYARNLLQQGDRDAIIRAEAELVKLKKALPDSLMTYEIEARVLQAKRQEDEAIKAVRDYANKKDADLPRAAMLLESLAEKGPARDKFLDAAEVLYRKHLAKSDKPERFLMLAGCLSRKGKVDGALDCCKKAQNHNVAPEALGQALNNVLRESHAGDEPCRRVEQWLKELVGRNNESISLLICLADLYDYQQLFTEAEKIYRAVLQKDPDNVMVLNNLAWLLAFQNGAVQHQEAKALINRATDLFGEGPELLDTRGMIYLAMGDVDAALRDMQAVVARDPSPSHFFHLARVYHKRNNLKEANRILNNEIKNFDPNQLHPMERDIGKRMMFEAKNKT